MVRLQFAGLVVLFSPLLSHAEETAAGIPSSTYLQAFLGLAAIVAVLLGAAYLGRKIWGGKGFGRGGLQVIGGVALSPRERLVLVEAGDTWLIIGVVPGQIRTLHRMPKGEIQPDTVEPLPFAQWLKHFSETRQ